MKEAGPDFDLRKETCREAEEAKGMENTTLKSGGSFVFSPASASKDHFCGAAS
jgi:hypothetical protein